MIGIGLSITDLFMGGATGPSIAVSNLSIAEAAANTAAVGTASISGTTTGTPVWAITDASSTFGINSSTGAITVSSNTAIATNASFQVTISVTGTTPSVPSLAATIWVVASQATLDLIAASDTGASSTDNITNVTQPTWDLTATLYAGDIIKFYDSTTLLFSHTLTSGEASLHEISDTYVFAQGTYSVQASISRGGFENTKSTAVTTTIDTTAPVLSSASGASSGTIQVNTDTTSGTMYWIVDTSSSTPTAAQVIAGHNAAGSAAAASGSGAVSASPYSVASSVAAGTYYAYFAQKDVAGNTSTVAASASFVVTVAYAGPLDAVGTNLSGFWGLRAKSAAYASAANPCIDIVNSATGTGTTTINLTASGYVDDAAVQSAITGGGWAGAAVSKVYDQVGTNHLLQATLANMPLYSSTAGPNSKPGLTAAGSNFHLTSAGNLTVALPWTMFAIAKRSGSFTTAQIPFIIPNSGSTQSLRLGFTSSANTITVATGSGLFPTDSTHSADSTFHAIIGNSESDGSSGNLWVDNNITSITAQPTNSATGAPVSIIGSGAGTAVLNGVWVESGIYNLDFNTAGRAAALNTNMHNAYGVW